MSAVEMIGLGLTVLGLLVPAAWTLLTLAMKQFEKRLDERFAAQEKLRAEARGVYERRFTYLEEENREREREHLRLMATLPEKFVRREDYIQNQTVIEAKLDALAVRFENMTLKGLTRD